MNSTAEATCAGSSGTSEFRDGGVHPAERLHVAQVIPRGHAVRDIEAHALLEGADDALQLGEAEVALEGRRGRLLDEPFDDALLVNLAHALQFDLPGGGGDDRRADR